MITDLNRVDRDPFSDKVFDFCICGAGVAGITLAMKLAKNFDVVLLEGGGLNFSQESQQLYRGENVGQHYRLNASRLRYFGGTSNHWAGWCTPMDAYDFERKSYVEYSGWPLGRAELDPFLRQTEQILDLPQRGHDPQRRYEWKAANVISASGDLNPREYKWSSPTRFGAKFRRAIHLSQSLTCYVNANVVDMRLYENLSGLAAVEVKNFSGKSFDVRAKTFILAAGGIENPRILLNCNKQLEHGLGNQKGLVGRFFAEHNNKNTATFILEDAAKKSLIDRWSPNSRLNSSYFSPSVSFMKQERILNFVALVEPFRRPTRQYSFQETMKNFLCEPHPPAGDAKDIAQKPECPSDGRIRIVSEQALDPSSRVSLGSEVDRFGMKWVALDWKQSRIDKRTIQRATLRLAEIFAQNSFGRVRIDDWVLTDDLDYPTRDGIAGHHHMGTTRMSDSPRDGVVDENQKVFGIDNLYVGGSSVFSTTGHDSPTITIVQMTLRLAQHLERAHRKTA